MQFEVLAHAATHEGVLTLWRRHEPEIDATVLEVKLGDEFLMSSMFTVAEEELARLGLAACHGGRLEVVVGGLGLGHTARAALRDDRVASLVVVEALAPVLAWHEQRLVPGADVLVEDVRTRLVHGDFFALARADGFDPDRPGRTFDAVLLDIDHTPRHVLHDSHAPFYAAEGLAELAGHLRPGGVFALWSNDPPDQDFMAVLGTVMADVAAHVVTFPGLRRGSESSNTVYVARRPEASRPQPGSRTDP